MKKFLLLFSITILFTNCNKPQPQNVYFEGIIYKAFTHTPRELEHIMTAIRESLDNMDISKEEYEKRLFNAKKKLLIGVPEENLSQYSWQTMYIKGNKLRIKDSVSTNNSVAEMIIDIDQNKAYNILSFKKSYLEIDLEQMKKNLETILQGTKAQAFPVPVNQNIKVKHNNFNCVKYRTEEEGYEKEYWITQNKDLMSIKNLYVKYLQITDLLNGDIYSTHAKEIENLDGFPVQIIERVDEISQTDDLLKIEKTSIPDSIFTPPSDYKKITPEK